ncbi:MAG: insulinase family protein, partial [Duncaniella sp.]|nr:insulinase family protein [Duncaniella sp.]
RKTVTSYNPGLFAKTGSGDDTFTTEMTTPQTYTAIMGYGDIEYTPKNAQIASIAGQIMTNRLLKTVREDMGAVYSISASGQLSRMGLNPAMISTSFPMKPEMKKEVLDFIHGQFKAMENDVTAEELAPIKEYMAKSYIQNKEHNSPWLGALTSYDINGVDSFNGYVDTLNSITINDIMDFMKALNAQGNYRTISLDPAK